MDILWKCWAGLREWSGISADLSWPYNRAALCWPVLRKIIRICKTQRISSSLGRSHLNTVRKKFFHRRCSYNTLCSRNYSHIALQLKAISSSIHILISYNRRERPLPISFRMILFISPSSSLYSLFFLEQDLSMPPKT